MCNRTFQGAANGSEGHRPFQPHHYSQSSCQGFYNAAGVLPTALQVNSVCRVPKQHHSSNNWYCNQKYRYGLVCVLRLPCPISDSLSNLMLHHVAIIPLTKSLRFMAWTCNKNNTLLSSNLYTHVAVVGNPKTLPTNILCLTASRADSIVADAELVRETLLISSDAQNSRWSLLGQSFGGFCAVQYLSAAPQGKQFLLSG